MAKKSNYITVAYKLYVSDGDDIQNDLVEECSVEHPFMFISGLGCVLPAFEKEIDSLKAGDAFDFTIPCEQAYGPFEEQLMFDVPKETFMLNGKFDEEHIFEGNIIPLQGEDGHRFNGVVIEVKGDAVTIDLNHPRAGQDLHFVGHVIDSRPATNEEISEMLNTTSECAGCGGDCNSGSCGGCGGGGCGGCH